MKEISNNESSKWIVAIMRIDDFSSFVFAKENNKMIIQSEIDKLEKEMYHLFAIYGNGKNKNEQKYFAYKLNNNSKFGLRILYDSKDAYEMLETLKEEIAIKFEFTVSIGCSRLHEDELGMSGDWYDRVCNNLKTAMKNGGNQVCFESCASDRVESKIDETSVGNESDVVQMKSLETIEV